MKTGTQPLRAVNRIPISSATLEFDNVARLAGHVSAGVQIHHPKGHRRLISVLHFNLRKPKDARVVLTIHHGAMTKSIVFPFGKSVNGNKMVKVRTPPQKDLGGVHLISTHAYAQRKSSKAKVQFNLKRIDVSS
ncbi:MAG TPA: hypothetical protein VN025_19200 [Candidatus Dormibacteraeota bacterium]|jgi:hypothetical protein|nr:hypothetical protein [Candidatus Dormibacteraeota bacterium]